MRLPFPWLMLLRSVSSWHLLTLGREKWLYSLTTEIHTCRDKTSVMDGSTISVIFTRTRDANLYLKIRQNIMCSGISPSCVAWKMSAIMEDAFMVWTQTTVPLFSFSYDCSITFHITFIYIHTRGGDCIPSRKNKHAVSIALSKSVNGLIHRRSITNSMLFRFKCLTRHKVKGKKTVKSLSQFTNTLVAPLKFTSLQNWWTGVVMWKVRTAVLMELWFRFASVISGLIPNFMGRLSDMCFYLTPTEWDVPFPKFICF